MNDESWRREVDNKLISHDKDIHTIAKSVQSIDESVKTMTELQVKQAIRDEHFQAQVKEVKAVAIRAHSRLDEHDKDKKKLTWLFITPVILSLVGTVVYKSSANDSINKKLDTLVSEIKKSK
jgi:hypothetical protein